MLPIRTALGVASVLAAFAVGPAALAADAVPGYVAQAVASPGRLPPEILADADRKPAELAAFSQIKPGDKIAEIVPGGGYYTRVLSKIVGLTGKLYAVVPMTANAQLVYRRQQEAAMRGLTPPSNPGAQALEISDTWDYKNVVVMQELLTQYNGHFSAPEQLDAVWSNTYHDFHNDEAGKLDAGNLNKAIFAALKPGGIYIVVDQASAKGVGFEAATFLHRSEPDAVKKEVLAAGFVLDGESSALANAGDNHLKAIWDSSLRGKPDTFVLRFKKPSTAPAADKRPGKDAMDGYYGNTVTGMEGSPFQRWVFYHADGTYQEWGLQNDPDDSAQFGLWYWDALGHNCMLHQYPLAQKGFIVCHATTPGKKLGEKWTEDNGGGARPFQMLKGYVYPPK